MTGSQRIDRLYDALVEDEDARVCTDISEDACTHLPRNFVILVLSNLMTKIGDALASPKTVLAWVVAATGSPEYLVALLVPLRESGSLLPQLFIAGFIRRMALRKWAWILGSVFQAVGILGIGLVATTMTGVAAGWAVVGCLALFSLARGVCSISHKDVLGKTVPKTRRGRVSGISASLSGVVAAATGLYLVVAVGNDGTSHGALVWIAGSMWALAAALFAWIRETPGESSGGGNAIVEGLRSLSLLRTDGPFRRFVIARTCALCSALTAPYYVLLGKQVSSTEGPAVLGAFVLADGLASALSASIWGRFADRSSRMVLAVAVGLASVLGLALFALQHAGPPWSSATGLYPVAFFLLGIAHSGVRLGRKTYVIDLAGGNKRTDYIAVSNTVIGVALLVAGGAGALTVGASPARMLLALSVVGLVGAVVAWRLPETA